MRRHRRDNNESGLILTAEQLGGLWLAGPPFDGWLHARGRWHLCEVKDPRKEGWASEFTKDQLRLILKLRERNVPWNVLRTDEDVYGLFGARRSA